MMSRGEFWSFSSSLIETVKPLSTSSIQSHHLLMKRMGASASHQSCFGFMGDGFDTRSSITSTHQQSIIIDKLRESQKKRERRTSRGRRRKVQIVPSDTIGSSQQYPDECLPDQRQSRMVASMEELDEADAEKMVSDFCQSTDLNEEQCLKSALTHPTVLTFLRSYMIAQGNNITLEFYLNVVEIRGLAKQRYYKEAHDLWLKVVPVFVIDGAPSQVPMSSNHREMITGNFSSNSRKIVKCAHPNSISLMGPNPNMKLAKSGAISKLKNHYVYLDKNILEGLRKAQYVAFLAIKRDSWIPFCDSDIFKSLLKKKEIRTTLALHDSVNHSHILHRDRSLSFASIYGDSDNGTVMGSGGGSFQAGNTNEIPGTSFSLRSSTSSYFLNLKASFDITSLRTSVSSASRYSDGRTVKNGPHMVSFVESATTTAMNSPNTKNYSLNGTAATSLADIPLGTDDNNDADVADKLSKTAAKKNFFLLRQIFSSNLSKKNRHRETVQNIANSNIRKIHERQQRHQQLIQGNKQQCLRQNGSFSRQEHGIQAMQQSTSNVMLTSRSQNIALHKYRFQPSQHEHINEDYQSELQPYKLWSSQNAQLISQMQESRGKEEDEKENSIKENENRKGSCNQPLYDMKNKIDKNGSLSARSNVSKRHVQNSEVRVFTTPRNQKHTVFSNITHDNKDNSEKSQNKFCYEDSHFITPIIKMKNNMNESEKMKHRGENFKLIPLNISIGDVGVSSNIKYSAHQQGSGRSCDSVSKMIRIPDCDDDYTSPYIEESVYSKKNITTMHSDTINTFNIDNDCKNDRNQFIDNNMNKNSSNNDTDSYGNNKNNPSDQCLIEYEDYIHVDSDEDEAGDGDGENEIYRRKMRSLNSHSTVACISPRASKLLAAEGLQQGFNKFYE